MFKCRFTPIIYAIIILFTSIAGTATENENPVLELTAKSAVLMEQSTGKVLFTKKPDEKLPIASVNKIMTMLLTMEAIDSGRISLEDIVVASERAKSMGGSTIFLDTGEEMSVSDLLKGIAVASGNDACVAIGEHIAGSEEGFVQMMNNRAAELGMQNTIFKNTNGLDVEGQYSTAADVALMSRELLKHPKIFEYTTIWMDDLRNGKFQLNNTNKLVRFYKGANGLKTGSTSQALFCVSGTAIRDNLQLIAVVLASPTSKERFADASKLLDYGFANYSIKRVVAAGEDLGSIKTDKGIEDTLPITAKDNFDVLLSKGDASPEFEVMVPESIMAPVKQGDKVGEVIVKLKGDEIGRVDVIASANVKKLGFSSIYYRLIKIWLCPR